MPEPKDPLVERALERVGTTLKGKWRLDELIGVGGMAAVYSATHRNGIRAAVKMLHPELALNAEVRSRFLREGYVANRVDHPGAVTVLDDEVTDDGAVFLVMELLEGETLAYRLERHPHSLVGPQILLIADQLLDVLAAAHDKQIVHRDIKPDNIFLTPGGDVKVLDFGIARLRELSTLSSATRSGSTMGTPAYMAPEQARARWDEVDGRTDLWAVGATMFKLLTGRVVHVAETVNEQLLAAMTQPAPRIATLVSTAPIPLVEIVDRALAFNRDDRWPDARQMQQAVRVAYKAITGAAPSSARLAFVEDSVPYIAQADTVSATSKAPTSLSVAHDSAPLRSRKPRRISALGGLVVMGVLGAGGYLALREPRRLALEAIFGAPDASTAGANALELADPVGTGKAAPGSLAPGEIGSFDRGEAGVLPAAAQPAEAFGDPAAQLPPPAPVAAEPAHASDPASLDPLLPPAAPAPEVPQSAPRPSAEAPPAASRPSVQAPSSARKVVQPKLTPARKSVARPPTRKRVTPHHRRP